MQAVCCQSISVPPVLRSLGTRAGLQGHTGASSRYTHKTSSWSPLAPQALIFTSLHWLASPGPLSPLTPSPPDPHGPCCHHCLSHRDLAPSPCAAPAPNCAAPISLSLDRTTFLVAHPPHSDPYTPTMPTFPLRPPAALCSAALAPQCENASLCTGEAGWS